MGSALCTLFKQQPVKVLYYGLDAAGKTTLLYKLKLGEVVTTIPTIGFNVEILEHNGVDMLTWDVGLRDKGRTLLRHYTATMDGVVFVVDSTDKDRLDDAVNEFFQLLVPDIGEKEVPVVVLANKQDKPHVLTAEQVKTAILKKGKLHSPLEVFPTVATTLEGVNPAMDWLTSQLLIKMAHDGKLPWRTSLSDTIRSASASFLESVKNILSATKDTNLVDAKSELIDAKSELVDAKL